MMQAFLRGIVFPCGCSDLIEKSSLLFANLLSCVMSPGKHLMLSASVGPRTRGFAVGCCSKAAIQAASGDRGSCCWTFISFVVFPFPPFACVFSFPGLSFPSFSFLCFCFSPFFTNVTASQVCLLQAGEAKQEHKPAPAPAPAKKDVHVGDSIGMAARNPLDLIKSDAPLLTEAKTSKQPKPLAPLVDEAGRDETCVWYRVSQTQAELLGSCLHQGHSVWLRIKCFNAMLKH